jgi:hypothetical protein
MPNSPLVDRLTAEQKTRPQGPLRAENVYDALEKAGVPITTRRQHLASPFLAQYCLGAETGERFAFSVCEYPDAKAAKAGRSEAEKIHIPNRTVTQNKTSVLVVLDLEKSKESGAIAQTARDTFARL